MRSRANVGPAFLLLLALAGCNRVYVPREGLVTSYENSQQMDARIGLWLSEEWRNAKWQKETGSNTATIPLGDTLVVNAEDLAKHLFLTVTNVDSEDISERQDLDAVLIPEMVVIEIAYPVWNFSKSTFSIKVEWTMKDRQGQIIWAETITGEARGYSTTHGEYEESLHKMLESLFKNSYDALASSVELRRFAG